MDKKKEAEIHCPFCGGVMHLGQKEMWCECGWSAPFGKWKKDKKKDRKETEEK